MKKSLADNAKSTKQELKQLSLKQINDIFKNFDLSLAPARELQISEPFKQFSLLKHVDFVVATNTAEITNAKLD